jgi:hypothetical protein
MNCSEVELFRFARPCDRVYSERKWLLRPAKYTRIVFCTENGHPTPGILGGRCLTADASLVQAMYVRASLS